MGCVDIRSYANGEPLLNWSSSHSHSSPVCDDSVVAWSANSNRVLLLLRLVPGQFMMILTDGFMRP